MRCLTFVTVLLVGGCAPGQQSNVDQSLIGVRASTVIGSPVYNDDDEKLGTLGDLIIRGNNEVALGIVSVGGVFGIGSKQVPIPYAQFSIDPYANRDGRNAHRVILPGMTRDKLKQMPQSLP